MYTHMYIYRERDIYIYVPHPMRITWPRAKGEGEDARRVDQADAGGWTALLFSGGTTYISLSLSLYIYIYMYTMLFIIIRICSKLSFV